ncbi:MAG: OmpA family protein [Betaproteobacteria bacterium]|nr:OmpA family protein [Betaproteobacteria bacterium]
MKRSAAIACVLITSGCATGPNGQSQSAGDVLKSTFASDDPCSNNARNIGIVAGVVAGGLIGKKVGDNKGVVLGAGVGAFIGGLIGADIDRRRCELSKVAKAHNLDIRMTDIKVPAQAPSGNAVQDAAQDAPKPETAGMSLTVLDRGNNQFASGSATPSPQAEKAFAAIADKYAVAPTGNDPNAVREAKERNKKMRILLVGHTDDMGSSQANADLSEGRARAIAKIFSQHGFGANQIYYQGAGEVYPIADNRTEEGRALNRRVEVVDLSDDAAFSAFLESRRPNVANYRPAAPTTVDTPRIASAPVKKSNDRKTAATASAATPAAPSARPQTASSVDATESKVPPSSITPSQAKREAGTVALGGLDFGGKRINGGAYKTVDIGQPVGGSSVFSLISRAHAADSLPVGSCATDRPRISNRVKSLESGQERKTSDYFPGTASSSWAGKANGHLVGLSGVAVLRDGGQPAGRPAFFIWKDWVDGSNAKPLLKTSGDVNVYRGDKALLYRVFPDEGPVRCVDMAISTSAPNTAPESTLIYEYGKAMYQADYSPVIAR